VSRLHTTHRLLKRWVKSTSFAVVAAVVLGLVIGAVLIPRPYVATLELTGYIDEEMSASMQKALNGLRTDRNVKAVVLEVDSPGGLVVSTQQICSDLLKLRAEKPVVAVVGSTGASGAYYLAVTCNYIYVQPTSLVGSIGALVGLPEPEELTEDLLTTGPFKATDRSVLDSIADLETVREQFVAVVMQNRKDRLKIGEEVLSRAEVYMGVQAVDLGLVDGFGTRSDGIEKAASLARIRNYGVTTWPLWDASEEVPTVESLKGEARLVPTYYYLHFESD
jgi:protease-4